MRRLVISDTAEDSLRSLNRYIADQSGRATADAVYDKLLARFERLATLPETLGTPRSDLARDLRSTPHHGYIVYFRYIGASLEIVDVLDARRDTFAHFAEPDADL